MSHRDTVTAVPAGFEVLARTSTCAIAAIADPSRRLYGVQFHPEVIHTLRGREVLSNFLFDVCRCERDWDPAGRAGQIEEEIRRAVGNNRVFFFVSGGVDSTVAFTLCLRAVGPERVRGAYVDTGLMREGETEFVRGVFESLGHGVVGVVDARERFLGALEGAREPEQKRHIIGEEFVAVQEEIIDTLHLLDGHWLLGQGTIYPDTIESGGTEKAATIKTHHNRVAGIQRLMQAGRIVEPLHSLYKDEVREVGRQLGLPRELLERHPFPGPGLAIRCLCAEQEATPEPAEGGYILPVRSVGVQGDCRSYAKVLALEAFPSAAAGLHGEATELINRVGGINRVVAKVDAVARIGELRSHRHALSASRLECLRKADAIVRRVCRESGFERKVWQFPVILLPVGVAGAPDSIVLRPIDSVDGMTAQSVLMEEALLRALAAELLTVPGIAAVFYDLTHKPPGTIEWE
jgi:GMP synthase (glutamine-hydrolysing)